MISIKYPTREKRSAIQTKKGNTMVNNDKCVDCGERPCTCGDYWE